MIVFALAFQLVSIRHKVLFFASVTLRLSSPLILAVVKPIALCFFNTLPIDSLSLSRGYTNLPRPLAAPFRDPSPTFKTA